MRGRSATLAPRSAAAPWSLHLGALGALLALIFIAFQYEVLNAVESWWVYPTYTHCFLVIPISLWLIWEKREELRRETPSVTTSGLLAIPFLLAFWFAANIATINEARQIALVGIMQVAILTTLGARVYRKVLFPSLYLFALVPVGQYLVPPMQLIATWFADTGLTLLGIAHYTEGTLIQLETGLFEVAEACAGLRFLIATVALGVLFAHLTYRSWWKIAAFLVACVVVPLVGNGLRCLGIIVLAYLTNNEVAVGADHLVYGWFFNMAILLFLFWAGLRFRDPQEDRAIAEPAGASPPAGRTVALTALAAALAIAAGPALAYLHEIRPIVMDESVFSRPLALQGWRTIPGDGAWFPNYVRPDTRYAATIVPESSDAPPVDLAIMYYARLREGRSLVSTMNKDWNIDRWHPAGGGSAMARIGGTDVVLGEAILAGGSQRRLVWSSYWIDGRFTRSGMTVKLLQMKTAFSGNEAAALVAVSTPIVESIDKAREQLRDALAALDVLPDRLAEAGRTGNIRKASR
jgi:exosortase A